MSDALWRLTIAEAADLVRTRRLSPVELTEALIARTATFDGQIHAYITPTPERALESARAAEAEIVAGRYRGPLHGIPFGLKDIYDTVGILTSAHSRVCLHNVPDTDATVTRLLYQAGGVLMGKLATHEFAFGGPSHDLPWPVPRNPWNIEHFAAGSSSGSGAAVAAGFVPAAMGSDTGGSIRGPAALCGIAGVKPTFGLVSRRGVIPNSWTFDHCGPMAWTVEDCAILLQAVAGHDPQDPASAPVAVPDYRSALKEDLRGVRIGVIRHFWERDVPAGDEMRRAMDAALSVLAGLGATIETAGMRPLQDYCDVRTLVSLAELFSLHRSDLIRRPGDFGAEFLRRTLAACVFQAADYVDALRERHVLLEEAAPLYRKYDVLLTAGIGPAPRLDQVIGIDFWRKPNIFYPFSVMGGPVLSVCHGYSASGLPLGMQIAGAPFQEERVLRVGHAYEKATSWRNTRPRLVEGTVAPPVTPAKTPPGPECNPAERRLVEDLAGRAGLNLGEREHALLLEAAPYALAMAQRLRRDRARSEEPALTSFSAPPAHPPL